MDTTNSPTARIEFDDSASIDAMRSIPAEPHPFGEVFDAYTRAQAIQDGSLVAVEEGIADEAGFRVPVAITRAAWQDCVAWSDADSARQTHQDESGRLWDVLNMTALSARRYREASRFVAALYRVPRGGRVRAPRLVQLLCVIGPGDSGEPVITISQPHEQD